MQPAVVWLVYFYAATMIIFTMYGGGFATIPAYLADMFGTRYVGGIHGRLLTAWSLAGVLGPVAITMLRERSIDAAIRDLVGDESIPSDSGRRSAPASSSSTRSSRSRRSRSRSSWRSRRPAPSIRRRASTTSRCT